MPVSKKYRPAALVKRLRRRFGRSFKALEKRIAKNPRMVLAGIFIFALGCVLLTLAPSGRKDRAAKPVIAAANSERPKLVMQPPPAEKPPHSASAAPSAAATPSTATVAAAAPSPALLPPPAAAPSITDIPSRAAREPGPVAPPPPASSRAPTPPTPAYTTPALTGPASTASAAPETADFLPPKPAAPPPDDALTPFIEAMMRPPMPKDLRPLPGGKPAWLRNAVPHGATGDRPLIAIVIDDLGIDKRRTAATIRLKGPLTLSFMTYASDLSSQTEAARAAGHELFLHVPMEAVDRHNDPGPHGLLTALPGEEILSRFRWDLGRFEGFVGINNHMGSRFTADAAGMTVVMEELRARGLAFLDSRTSPASAGIRLAVAYGVAHAARDVFLDNEISPGPIATQLAATERDARRNGSVIAIGHPHDPTVAALAAWLPQLEAKGFALVPVSAVIRYRATEGSARAEAPQ